MRRCVRQWRTLIWIVPLVLHVPLGSDTDAQGTTPQEKTSVFVLDDQLHPIPGALVQFDDGASAARSTMTDSYGQTPWIDLNPSGGQRLILGETLTADGIALGSIESLAATPLTNEGEDEHLWEIGRAMPLATPLAVRGIQGDSANYWPPRGVAPHWRIALPVGSPLAFSMHVATLMDGEAVARYGAYRGTQLAPNLYVRGVVLVLPTVDLGRDGLDVSVALHGDLPGEALAADLFLFTRGKVRPVARGFEMRNRGRTGDMLCVGLRGVVPAGQLAVLVRAASSGPGVVRVLRDDPPDLVISASSEGAGREHDEPGVSGSVDGPSVSECDPPVPVVSGWTCLPADPTTSCPGYFISGAPQCQITRTRTDRFCRPAGSTRKQKKETITEFKTSFETSGSIPAVFKTTGGFAYGMRDTTIATDSWTAMAGASDLGQCTRYFLFYLDCKQEWRVFVDKEIRTGWLGNTEIHPCAAVQHVTTYCHDKTDSQTVCDRTP